MEKALVKMGSIKAGSFWLTKKAKQEFNNITQDLTVCQLLPYNVPYSCLAIVIYLCFLSCEVTFCLNYELIGGIMNVVSVA